MEEISGNLNQWKIMWQLVSGIHFETPRENVKDRLLDVSKELQDGIFMYRKNEKTSDEKLAKIIKEGNRQKILPFALKLQQFLDLDALQSWNILCFYLVNEYRGPASALSEYISSEASMLKLLTDIWSYYSSERIILLKIVKNILEYYGHEKHPYYNEYKALLDKIGIPNLRKSYISQLEYLLKEAGTTKIVPGDMMNDQNKLTACAERKSREIYEILHIILAIIHHDGIKSSEIKQLVELFKTHMFGRQQQHLLTTNSHHNELVTKITYSEIAILLKAFDMFDKDYDIIWIREVIKYLDHQIMSLHQYPEHGPLLLVWMLFNFRLEISEEDEITSKYRQFGSRAIQLGVFDYLTNMLKHSMFKENSITCEIVRKSIYNHISHLCQLFDSDGSVGMHDKIYDLLSELLKSSSIGNEFCKNEEAPIRSLFDTAIELFPVDFVPLSMIAHSLASSGIHQNKYIYKLLDNLPVYTEVYNPEKFLHLIRGSSCDDEVILTQNFTPFKKIDYSIPRGTSAAIIDKRFQTFIHFRTKFNYFNALHNEIDELLNDSLQYYEIDRERVRRITVGMKYLVVAVKGITNPNDISGEMVHPTEMAFDILIKFKNIQNPPVELLAECLNVCTALIPLFEPDVFTRMVKLNIFPVVNNENLDFKDYINGHSFESNLVGYYLINFEKNSGKYIFLMAYLNFLMVYFKLGKNNVFAIELPGLIFLLREVFTHAQGWRFDSESDRIKLYVAILTYFFEIVQISEEKLHKDRSRSILRNACVFSLLNVDNGLTLLKFVGIGNTLLQSVMENEPYWMKSSNHNLNIVVQHSMTILMQILRLKHVVVEDPKALSALESAIYTQPKQRDTLRIIPVVTSYMDNIFNRRLSVLACRLLRRFALEFKMSLLACLDMEPDQIRMIFLQRLRDDLESDDLKIAILEFVDACIQKQPGLTEAFFKVSYENSAHRLILGEKPTDIKNISEGILIYMEDYLHAVSTDTEMLQSPLLTRIMTLFHALWKNNMQTLIKDLLVKPKFWSSMCSPLFGNISNNTRAYSQLFNIIGIELFKMTSDMEIDINMKEMFQKFFSFDYFSKWVDNIFRMPKEIQQNKDLSFDDVTPDWLGRLQSFKDLIVLLLKKKNPHFSLSDRSKKYLAEKCLDSLIERADYIEDLRPFVILSELFLLILAEYEYRYTNTVQEDALMLEKIDRLISTLSISYKDVHQRAKESILAIIIKSIDLQADELLKNQAITSSITRSIVDIICVELFELEILAKAELKTENKIERRHISFLLSINLLEKIVFTFDERNSSNWDCWFVRNKIFNRLLSILSMILPIYSMRKVTCEIFNLLVILAKSSCSKEMLHADIGDYLWLKLLPPKELLQRPFMVANGNEGTWHTQDWWPIYARGIELVRVLLAEHKHCFLKEAIFFSGIHEEFLIDSLLLAKQSMESSAVILIKTTLGFLCETVTYEKEWQLESSQSLMNLMRCVQILMGHSVSLLYRPKILKRLTEAHSKPLIEITDLNEEDTSDSLVAVMNDLVEIVALCSQCLLKFSPKLINLICDVEFAPSQWFPLIDVQFGTPKINTEAHVQLSFGTILSAACIFTKVLNLQHFSFSEVPLNDLPNEDEDGQSVLSESTVQMNESTLGQLHGNLSSNSPVSTNLQNRQSSPRTPFSKSLSMTSAASFQSTSVLVAPSNELLSHLDGKLCVNALEFLLTLLASQSLLAFKDANLSSREKQLIRRELSTELLIFHDFVKKRILKDGKSFLQRKKFGICPIYNDTDNLNSEGGSAKSNAQKTPSRKSSSMRVNVVRKLHLQQQTPFSPIASSSTPKRPTLASSTPKPGEQQSVPIKRVTFDDNNMPDKVYVTEQEEEQIFYEPVDAKYTGLSYVKVVEEDYLHFLSNIFTIICHSEN